MSNGTTYYGIYRAEVVRVIDPDENIGRVEVRVVSIPGEEDVHRWAMPCVPYAGASRGLSLPPDVGDTVWVEFEGGDLTKPVWVGSYWQDGDLALRGLKFLRTTAGTAVTFDDGADEVRIETPNGAVIKVGADGEKQILSIENGQGAVVKLVGPNVTFEGWPMKFKPASTSDAAVDGRLEALEAAIAVITGQPFPPET